MPKITPRAAPAQPPTLLPRDDGTSNTSLAQVFQGGQASGAWVLTAAEAGMRQRVRALLPASDAENYKRLSEYFNIPVEHLEARLPYLRWEAQGPFFVVRENARNVLLNFSVGQLSEIDPALLDDDAEQAGLRKEARELKMLMTDYVPRRVQAMLIGRAVEVRIDSEVFNLPNVVMEKNGLTAQITFNDGSKLNLLKQSTLNGSYFVPAGEVKPRSPVASSSNAQPFPAFTPIVLLSSTQEQNEYNTDVNSDYFEEGMSDDPLFGLTADTHLARLVKQEPDDDYPMPLPSGTGKHRLSPGRDMDEEDRHKRARVEANASAQQRWEARSAAQPATLPEWGQLSPTAQLCLRAAAISVPSEEEYALTFEAAENAGVPFRGEEIVARYPVARFDLMVEGVVQAADQVRKPRSVVSLRARIARLCEGDNRTVAGELLDEAERQAVAAGETPGILREGKAYNEFSQAMKLLECVEQKNADGNQTSKQWLLSAMDRFLAGVRNKNEPDPVTSNMCVQELETLLGIPATSLVFAKPAIKALTKVDLAFRYTATAAGANPADNRIPRGPKFHGLHGRHAKLKLPANKEVFGALCDARARVRAKDRNDGRPAPTLDAAMRFLEALEGRKDDSGRPAPRAAEPWFRRLAANVLFPDLRTLNKEQKMAIVMQAHMPGLPDLGALNEEQLMDLVADAKLPDLSDLGTEKRNAIVKALKNDPDVRAFGGPSPLYSLFCSMTGVSLWSK